MSAPRGVDFQSWKEFVSNGGFHPFTIRYQEPKTAARQITLWNSLLGPGAWKNENGCALWAAIYFYRDFDLTAERARNIMVDKATVRLTAQFGKTRRGMNCQIVEVDQSKFRIRTAQFKNARWISFSQVSCAAARVQKYTWVYGR